MNIFLKVGRLYRTTKEDGWCSVLPGNTIWIHKGELVIYLGVEDCVCVFMYKDQKFRVRRDFAYQYIQNHMEEV